MPVTFPINALVDALRAKILEVWPEVTRVSEGLSPEDFTPANLPFACIVKHPTGITRGKPAVNDLMAVTCFDICYAQAHGATPAPVMDSCRQRCADLLQYIQTDPNLMLNGEPTCLQATAVCLDDTPDNAVMQLVQRHRWPISACVLRVECVWTESTISQLT